MNCSSPSSSPWERQPDETSRSFEAFRTFRDLGPTRTLREAAAEFYSVETPTAAKIRQFEQWSATNLWVERSGQWDAELDDRRREGQLDAIERMKERHIEVATKLLQIVERSVERFAEEMDRDPTKRLPVHSLASFVRVATELERVSRGEPGEIVKQLQESGDQVVQIVWGDEEEAKKAWEREEQEELEMAVDRGTSDRSVGSV